MDQGTEEGRSTRPACPPGADCKEWGESVARLVNEGHVGKSREKALRGWNSIRKMVKVLVGIFLAKAIFHF